MQTRNVIVLTAAVVIAGLTCLYIDGRFKAVDERFDRMDKKIRKYGESHLLKEQIKGSTTG